MRNTSSSTQSTSTKSAALAAAGYVGTTHVQITVREAKRTRGGR